MNDVTSGIVIGIAYWYR